MSYSSRSPRTSFKYRNNQKRTTRTNNRHTSNARIDPRRFIAAASMSETEVYVPKHTFNDFSLNAVLQANVRAKGYETPTPIQDQAIPVGLEGYDVLGMAGTGTGKTMAFALPVLQRLMSDKQAAALIIAPTRELAQQIEIECRALLRQSGLKAALLIGGTGMGRQLQDLRMRPRLVVGTPGRIKDHLERGTLKLQHFQLLVLDEVDRMLDMGFVHDIRTIIGQMSQQRQSFFFSATMNEPVRRLINDFTTDPVIIKIQSITNSENVHQDVIRYTDSAKKMEQLHELLIKQEVSKAIIFEETQRGVDRLNRELVGRGFKTESMHGGKTQGQRQRALMKFKNSEVTILVATDVAARGIDVVDITHVINFSIPKEYDDYIHRIGRAGRAGRVGYAYTFFPHNAYS